MTEKSAYLADGVQNLAVLLRDFDFGRKAGNFGDKAWCVTQYLDHTIQETSVT